MEENNCKSLSHKGLISRKRKEFLEHNNKKITQLKTDKILYLNRHFSNKDIQMINKHMKRQSTELVIGEMQIKTMMRYHFTPLG